MIVADTAFLFVWNILKSRNTHISYHMPGCIESIGSSVLVQNQNRHTVYVACTKHSFLNINNIKIIKLFFWDANNTGVYF